MSTTRPLSVAIALCVSAAVARAQCPAWNGNFHPPGVNGVVNAMLEFDDGSGPALFLGGEFNVAGPISAKHVVKWDGEHWSALGLGTNKRVNALAVYDDGSGPALYATGSFGLADDYPVSGIAKWDGSQWSSVGGGLNNPGHSLAVFDDGSGSALFVTGALTSAGGVAVSGIAKWNGSTWSAVGSGTSVSAGAMIVFDDGSGEALYAAGHIGAAHDAVIKWNGSTWTSIGTFGSGGIVNALEVHDDGTGAALCAGGYFTSIDGVSAQNLAKWDGGAWQALGAGIPTANVLALHSFDDGSGARLFAGGYFDVNGASDPPLLESWDGAAWSVVGGGVDGTIGTLVASLGVFDDDGSGAKLWVGGQFSSAGTLGVSDFAGWDGATWTSPEPEGQGIENYYSAHIEVLAALDDGSGPALYAGGNFPRAGTTLANSIARWDGTSWSALGNGLGNGAYFDTVHALAIYDDGSGGTLYAGGSFTWLDYVFYGGVARWDGATWSPVGGGVAGAAIPSIVETMVAFDDGSGSALFIGGDFTSAGGTLASYVAKWNGSTWQPVGTGFNNTVESLIVFDDGSGPALYAGGWFTSSGGVSTKRVARWNGSTWSALGTGMNDSVYVLAVHDDGSGSALYAGGAFTNASGVSAPYVAKWNGAAWTSVGGGINGYVESLQSFDDGTGRALFAGGKFSSAGGTSANNIAKWNGSSWSALGDGLTIFATCATLAVFQDGSAPNGVLYAGGAFELADGQPSMTIARWVDTCACSGTSYCTSGTTSHGCVPTISATGTASASASSGFTISIASVEGQKQGHVFYGLNGPNAAPWGASSHFLCVKAPTQRTGTQDSGGTAGACDGVIALDWNNYIATHPTSLGVPFSAGTSVWAQLYFRDPPGPKTTALSNGLMFTVCP